MFNQSLLSGVCLTLAVATGAACAATLSSADKQFIVMVAKADMTEAHEGQMAENQARRPDVKDFAKVLTADHSESYWHLSQLAAKEGVSIPKGINAAKDPTIRQLTPLKGDRFDHEFGQDEVAAHRRLLAAAKREAAHGQDADVKEFANKMIPVLEKHLELAEKCAKPAGKS